MPDPAFPEADLAITPIRGVGRFVGKAAALFRFVAMVSSMISPHATQRQAVYGSTGLALWGSSRMLETIRPWHRGQFTVNPRGNEKVVSTSQRREETIHREAKSVKGTNAGVNQRRSRLTLSVRPRVHPCSWVRNP